MSFITDISEEYEFVPEFLVYADEPLEGFLRMKATGDLFVFRTSVIIDAVLWHWVLLPVVTMRNDLQEVFDEMASRDDGKWLSIVEDRRDGRSRLHPAWISGKRVPGAVLRR